jgi:RNA polymerase nonessential primary-like sigma factor
MKTADRPDGMTLEEIAQIVGVTRERIRQIEAKALRKLRLGLMRSGLTEADALEALRDLAQRHR